MIKPEKLKLKADAGDPFTAHIVDNELDPSDPDVIALPPKLFNDSAAFGLIAQDFPPPRQPGSVRVPVIQNVDVLDERTPFVYAP